MLPRLGFIGAGNMACALIGGLRAREALGPVPVVIEPSPSAREALRARFEIVALPEPDATLSTCSAVVVAVKPQHMQAAVGALQPYVGDALVISVAAGIPTAAIARWLGRPAAVVRCMPNTPALIGAGITGLYANPATSASQRALADALLCAVGTTVWVGDEALLDAVTAVSGSGPAYVFYFIEALEAAARELGLDAESSRRLALATFSGAVRLAEASEDPLPVLRERVTSKGGTTHAALTELARAQSAEHLVEAVKAAARRAAEMGREFGDD